MDFSTLFAGLVFSSIGLAAAQIGRKRSSPGKIGIGIALMAVPFLVDGWALWLIGALLTGGLWVVP